eukprot:TRINITY_DN3963_c0_g1_i1.p1 TRINITY_DN3963_c0_g1~~TRINITY_DN3963_c0_g1_i1.p1  ORF type:complete len:248 (-),score=-20.73 TRINITY_DN3963_c0_g1_i1:443-1186(-)
MKRLDLGLLPALKVRDERIFDWDADVIQGSGGALLVGSADAVRSGEREARGVRTVVSCVNSLEERKLRGRIEEWGRSDSWLHVQLSDEEGEECALAEVARFIEEHEKPVLVHCWQGISRSTTFASAWLMRHFGVGPVGAVAMVRRDRPIAHPNPGFMRALHAFNYVLRPLESVSAEAFRGDMPNSHWLVPERVLVGAWPARLREGITHVVDLTEEGEGEKRGMARYEVPEGVQRISFPHCGWSRGGR